MKRSFLNCIAGIFCLVCLSQTGQAQSPGLRFNQAWLAISQPACLAKARQALANGQYQITGQGDWWIASTNLTTRTAVCVSCLAAGAQTQAYVSAAGASDPLAAQWVDYTLKYLANTQAAIPALVPVAGQVPSTTLRFNQTWFPISQSDCLAKARQALANGQYQITGQGDWWIASSNQAARTAVCVSCITVGTQTQAYVTAAGPSDPLATQWVEYLLKFMASGQTIPINNTGTAIDWSGSVSKLSFTAADLGKRVVYTCPAGGAFHTVWGTDVYTHDSSICTAAAHSGLITYQSGGTVALEILAGQSSYVSSNRYGITTNSFGNWGLSFRFVR